MSLISADRQLGHGRRIRVNAVYSLVGLVVPNILLLAATPLLVRGLGDSGYGLWSIGIAAFGLFTPFEFGLGTAVAKHVAEHVGRGNLDALSTSVTTAFLACATLGLSTSVLLWLAAPAIAPLFHGPPGRVEPIIGLVAIGVFPVMLKSAGVSVAVGVQRFEIPMVINVIQNLLVIGAAVVIVHLGGSASAVIVSSVAAIWVVAVASVWHGTAALWSLGARPRLRRAYVPATLRYVALTGTTGVGAVLFGSLDRIVVGAVMGLRAVTYYSVSIGVANKLLALADVVSRPLMPAASAHSGAGAWPNIRTQFVRATQLVTVGSGAIAVPLVLFAPYVLDMWVGAPFEHHAIGVFRALVVVYALIAIAAPGFHTANGLGYPGVCATASVLGGAGTLCLIAVAGARADVSAAGWANAAYLINLAIPLYVIRRLRRAPQAHDVPAPTLT